MGRFRAAGLGWIGLGLVLGTFAVGGLIGAVVHHQDRLEEARRPADQVYVVVASRVLYPGVKITEDDLRMKPMEPRFVPDGSFLDPAHVVGRIPRERILGQDLVRQGRLANPDLGIGLNAVIPLGFRAVSIEIDNGPALRGFLQPGAHVDVLASVTIDDLDTTLTLLEDVYVAGVDDRLAAETPVDPKNQRQQRPSVTLILTPDDAERLAQAEVTGRLHLTLRQGTDDARVAAGAVVLCELRQDCADPTPVRTSSPPPDPEQGCFVLVTNGATQVSHRVPCSDGGTGRFRQWSVGL